MNPLLSERASLASVLRACLGHRLAFASYVWLWACLSLYGQELPRFREHVIIKELKFGYQLVVADLNGDGKPDIVCIGASTGNVKLYENLGK
jgi:hypothetical protein